MNFGGKRGGLCLSIENKFITDPKNYVISLVIYPSVTALDIVEPRVFSGLPGLIIHRIWKNLNAIATDDGMRILPDTTFANCPTLDLVSAVVWDRRQQ